MQVGVRSCAGSPCAARHSRFWCIRSCGGVHWLKGQNKGQKREGPGRVSPALYSPCGYIDTRSAYPVLPRFFRCSLMYRRIARRYSSRVALARSNPARASIISSRRSAKYRRRSPDAIPPRRDSSRCSSGDMVLNGRKFSLFIHGSLSLHLNSRSSRAISSRRRRWCWS